MFKRSLLTILILLGELFVTVRLACETEWTSYNDELCYRIYETQILTYQDASAFCSNELSSATLPTIKFPAEQAFLADLIYNEHEIVDNVWLGAKRSISGEFVWTNDNSPLNYSNWAPGAPSNDSAKDCAQMSSRLSKSSGTVRAEGDGFWHDVSCLSRRMVVCQAPIVLSLAELQKLLMDTRKQIEYNPVPLGFIYVQLMDQPTPSTIWPTVTWTEITADYAGQFFRAEGGNSMPFGQSQGENDRFLREARWAPPTTVQVSIPLASWSETLLTAQTAGDTYRLDGMSFYVDYLDTARRETRPYNSAIRIWKRTE